MHLVTRAVLQLYHIAESTGLLETPLVKYLFIRSYFLYKRIFEDPFAQLVEAGPDLFRGGNIIDIGANIGYTTTIFAKALSPGFKVIAFEPELRNFSYLKDTVAKFRIESKVDCYRAAIGERDGSVELWINRDHHADHRVLTDELRNTLSQRGQDNSETRQAQNVPLRSIDSFLTEQNRLSPVSFVKIDVQGLEISVLEGMKATLEANPHICVSFEYDEQSMLDMRQTGASLLDFFYKKGFNLYLIENNGTLIPFDQNVLKDILRHRAYLNLIGSRKQL